MERTKTIAILKVVCKYCHRIASQCDNCSNLISENDVIYCDYASHASFHFCDNCMKDR